ncbi:glycosyl transferase, group 1 [Nautilia profundicola AmH]|uniref:Glycosyl transferase, group 1 n=1 Tax=Nautilia profundicola (strain ATCC BAA-1463 / DSM 18972 / AmH) TaxID=598659 RepID=B9L634_NAUPA|nr:GT4 family glycosyltransferase PelF [Nautilia profundicola]ACM93353.1 glycosyl transferase, group 1 [Nautilia profundicola AmH]
MILRNGDYDILIVAEGTYPYVRGGVSSWIHQLITGLNEFKFGLVFIGSAESDYQEIKYELPENLTYLYVDYLFKKEETPSPKYIPKYKDFNIVEQLHEWFNSKDQTMPEYVKSLKFYNTTASFEKFLYSESSWEYIQKNYMKNTPDSPFIDYFWSVRNMHTPIWRVVNIANNIKKPKMVHSPSTGYAGFLASLLSSNYKIPFVLTEHGIYVRERKIDMLNTNLFKENKSIFQKKLGELAYAKQMWIKFFENIGKITYESADIIISLFEKARKIQIEYGADKNKTKVIPNGVDVEELSKLRKNEIPKVVSLIGRVVPIKDIKTFIKAVKIASEEIGGLEGWIVGPEDEDETYAKECHTLVDLLGLGEKVKFLGFQNIKDILPKTGLLTLSSISEGMPLTIIEGFAAGIPAVTTDVGSCKDLIYGGNQEDKKLGKAGEVVSIANPTELAKAYVKFFKNEDLYNDAKKAAIKRVEKLYTKEMFLKNYRDIYLKYLEK